MFDFEKYWEKHGVHTDPAIMGLAFKECAKKVLDAAMAEIMPLIPVRPSVQTILKAFNKDGEEVPYAIEDGDFTFCLPIGFTLTKEKNHARKRNSHA